MEYLKEIYKINIEDFEEYSYLRNIPSLKNFQGIKIDKPVTFFVGENGSGKSTLLEAIAVALGLNPEGGSKNFNFATKETHSELGKLLEIARGPMREEDGFFLRAESFYNSHGESFRSLILNRFRARGIYLLDEPEAALSPTSQMSLLCIIDELVKKDTQFIIASHSPIILAYPNADIYEFSEAGIEKKSYKETESYSVTKAFLDDPERMMNFLFDY